MQMCVLSTHSHHANIEDKVLQKTQEENNSGDNRTDGKYGKYCILVCILHMQLYLFASVFIHSNYHHLHYLFPVLPDWTRLYGLFELFALQVANVAGKCGQIFIEFLFALLEKEMWQFFHLNFAKTCKSQLKLFYLHKVLRQNLGKVKAVLGYITIYQALNISQVSFILKYENGEYMIQL